MSIFQRFKGLSGALAALAAQRKEVANQENSEASEPPLFECRICKHQGRQAEYCPDCLAPTMQPITADRQ